MNFLILRIEFLPFFDYLFALFQYTHRFYDFFFSYLFEIFIIVTKYTFYAFLLYENWKMIK